MISQVVNTIPIYNPINYAIYLEEKQKMNHSNIFHITEKLSPQL